MLFNRSVSATAHGKVNLYFEVGPRRDDGYHRVASLYAAVSLREKVTVTGGSRAGITLSLSIVAGSALAELERKGKFARSRIPLDQGNLAHRAAVAVLKAQGIDPYAQALHLHIDKEIPVAGGMAGGSADAAAALRAVNQYTVEAGWAKKPLSQAELTGLAAQLGADVPFCLRGGLAVGEGIGENLTFLDIPQDTEPLHLVMILNDRGLSTPAVFAELDRGRAAGRYAQATGSPRVPQELIATLAAGGRLDRQKIAGLIHNDLQPAALHLAPELHQRLATLPAGIMTGFVSGSGPTLALLPKTPGLDTTDFSTLGGVPVFCRLVYTPVSSLNAHQN